MAEHVIDPVNRIEGHQKWTVEIDDGDGHTVIGSKVHGMMFRGWENILRKRDPRDSIIICQRI